MHRQSLLPAPLLPALLTPAELSASLRATDERPVILDVRWTLAGSDPEGYARAHLPGARFVDLDRCLAAPPGARGRHPLPPREDLARLWRSLGIGTDSAVVVYDGGPGLAAARAWWLLRWSGVPGARVLDGGLPGWLADSARPVESGPDEAPAGAGDGDDQRPGRAFRFGSMPVVEIDAAAEIARDGAGVLLDARAAPRFRGEVEPLDPVAGHIPGAVNLPAAELIGPGGSYRPRAELAAAFAAAGLPTAGGPALAAASCGSGITACQLVLAGEIAGLRLALFPGSYSQWCAAGRPVAVGD